MPIESVVQSLSPGQRVELYQLDATIVGSGIYHFTSGQYGNTPVKFNGISYTPIDLDATGFDYSGQGASPRPKIKISNAASFLAGEIIQYNDMVGSTFTRIRTYKQFLDGQPLADPSVMLPVDIYRVDRKSAFNKVYIEWELASVLDQEGKMLPGRQVIKHNCTLTYRYWNGTTFDYTRATCPYSGTNYYDIGGNIMTSPAGDACGKLLSSCRLRFTASQDIPFGGFPGSGEH